MGRERSGPGDRRGLSEITGLVLLFGLVIVGAVIVVMTGTAIQDGVTEQSRVDSATQSLQEVDAELTSLTRDSNPQTISLTPAEREGENVRVVRGDEMTITIEADGTVCEATVALDAIHHTGAAENTVIVYQAGGVWRHSGDGSVMVSPPGVSYREGTLEFSLVKLASDLDGTSGFQAERVDDASRQRSQAIQEQLFADDACTRPDKVTIEVDSEYGDAWYDYFAQEMPDAAPISTVGGNVTVELDESLLARAADDARNEVVDFTDSSEPGTVHGDGVSVDKGAGNAYDARLQYVTARLGHDEVDTDIIWQNETKTKQVQKTLPVDQIENIVENDTVTVNRTYWDNETVERDETVIEGAPLDVEFVIDESTSMDQPCGLFSSSDCTTRIEYAVQATEGFLGEMPDNKARAGLVGYTWNNLFGDKTKQYQSLTDNYDAINGSLGSLSAGGSTPIDRGLEVALDDLDANSNDNHDRVVVLLSDGGDNRGDDPIVQAERAADMNVTVHTIGVGDDDEDLMQDIADETGGDYYHVSNAANLEDVFESIIRDKTTTEETESSLESEWVTVPVDEVDEITRRDEVEVRYTVETEIPKQVTTYDRDVVKQPVTLEYKKDDTPSWQTAFSSGSGLDAAVNYFELGYRSGDYQSSEAMDLEDGDRVRFDAKELSCGSEVNTSATLTDSGDTYYIHRCDSAGPASSFDSLTVYNDNEPVPTASPGEPWWQSAVASRLPAEYTSAGQFDLASNEVVVVAETVEDGATNYAVMVYEVGKSDEVRTDWVVDLTINVIDVEATN